MEAQKILGYGTEVIFLINNNTGGCMKKKKPWHYVKQRAKVKNIKYEYVYVEDLEKLNKAAKKKIKIITSQIRSWSI